MELSSIADAIRAEGGRVTFARFMELALTHPTLGYYSRVGRLLRHGGDFSTAPALSPFFNKTLARLITELLDASLAESTAPTPMAAGPTGAPPTRTVAIPGVDRADLVERPGVVDRLSVVELGGGEGHLAERILSFWERDRPDLREKIGYRIVEVGAGLKERQKTVLDGLIAVGWDVGWGADLQEACVGTRPRVIVGNEFLDAMPVHLLRVDATVMREAYVEAADSGLVQAWGHVSEQAGAEIELLFGTLDPRRLAAHTEDGTLEICPGVRALVREAARLMPAGSFVNVDYGEWFPGLLETAGCTCRLRGLEGRSQRRRTVRGYFKHQVVTDPLARAGRQDLTADVDFGALDLHGRLAGFETVLFTTLAVFLRAGGAEGELQTLHAGTVEAASDTLEADRQATVLGNLLNEEDLGGAFKVMVQVRG